jgi:two-component system, NarL family, nitrate/nitrite response regulator NarL
MSDSQQTEQVRNILLVDDSEFERIIIRSAVEGLTNFRICGEASNGVEGIEQAIKLKPDLVVMDLAMPLLNGLEAATVLKNTMPGVPIVLLTLYAEQIYGLKSATFGITTVLSKFDGLAPLLRCVQSLLGAGGIA